MPALRRAPECCEERALLSAAGWPLPRRLHADKVSVVNSLWPMDSLLEGRLLPTGEGAPGARAQSHAPLAGSAEVPHALAVEPACEPARRCRL